MLAEMSRGSEVGHYFQKKTQLQQCTEQCQCDYNVSIRVLQQYVKTQHSGNFTTSVLYYNRFSQLGKPSVYHTPRRLFNFNSVIRSLAGPQQMSRDLVCKHLYMYITLIMLVYFCIM